MKATFGSSQKLLFVICQQLKLCVREIEVDSPSKKAENLCFQFIPVFVSFQPKINLSAETCYCFLKLTYFEIPCCTPEKGSC